MSSSMVRLFAARCLVHICENAEVARHARADLEARYDDLDCQISEHPSSSVVLDFGGMISMAWKTIEIKSGDITFEFWPHQLDGVVWQLTQAIEKERAGGFIKLKGAYVNICLSTQTARDIREQILGRNDEMASARDASLDLLDASLKQLGDHPNIGVAKKADPKNAN